MKALVVYESMFGNTETIAKAIAAGLATSVPVDVVEVGSAPAAVTADLVVVGGPTHGLSMTRPNTRASAAKQADSDLVSRGTGIREWLDALSPERAQPVAVFDTKVWHGRWFAGSAARAAARTLRKRGFAVVGKPENFYVSGGKGPLVTGEVERARRWGETLAAQIDRSPAAATRE